MTSIHADLGNKAPYRPEKISKALNDDVDHFVEAVAKALVKYRKTTGNEGTLTAPFDSELFGHWWFEGPEFIKRLLKKLDEDRRISCMTCSEVLDTEAPHHVIAIPEGSWGAGGSHFVWLNHDVAWMWELLYEDELQMQETVRRHHDTDDPTLRRVLKQMARELWLLEASDWQFLISTKSAIDYAIRRFREHHSRFQALSKLAGKWAASHEWNEDEKDLFERCCAEDDIFAEELIDVKWFLNGQAQ